MPPMRYLIVIFAFTSWPFIWADLLGFKIAFIVLPVVMAMSMLMSEKPLRINPVVICLFCYFTIVLASTATAVYSKDRILVVSRTVIYASLVAGAIAMASVAFEELFRAANAIIRLYVIISLPSILIFLSLLINYELAYVNINLSDRGDFYRLYPFGVISEHATFSFGEGNIVRINGFSEEPGVLGTYAVFMIILNKLVGRPPTKRRIELGLHVLGTLSFSLFYFVSVAIFVLGGWLQAVGKVVRGGVVYMRIWGLVRRSAIIIAVVATVAISVTPGNPLYYLTIARVFVSEDGRVMSGNSRLDNDERVAEYIGQAHLTRVLIGNGPGSNSRDDSAGYASWAAELYDTGLMSLAVIAAMFVYCLVRFAVVCGRFDIAKFCTLLPAALSFYQRPEVIGPIVIIFWIVVARVSGRRHSPA